jgi:hypothetical protein
MEAVVAQYVVTNENSFLIVGVNIEYGHKKI